MNSKSKIIEVKDENCPWNDDVFGRRKQDALMLMRALDRHFERSTVAGSTLPKHCVTNIRASWGAGKTYFMKRLATQLKQRGHLVAYFDAWSTDFSNDPLTSFIAEIDSEIAPQLKGRNKSAILFRKVIETGSRVAVQSAKVAANVVTRKLLSHGIDELGEVFTKSAEEAAGEKAILKGAGDEIAKLAMQRIKDHKTQKETIREFKRGLSDLVSKLDGYEPPLFILIDELDRCRPSYAIELLEAVKHVFEADGVYFVVATNLDQLTHSIRAVYGHDFDGETYLRRFFDREFLLPPPGDEMFAKHILNTEDWRGRVYLYPMLNPDDETKPVLLFHIICQSAGLSLRDQKQVADALDVSIALLFEKTGEKAHLTWLFFILIVKFKSARLFDEIPKYSEAGVMELISNPAVLAYDPVIEVSRSRNRSDLTLRAILSAYAQLWDSNEDRFRSMINAETLAGEIAFNVGNTYSAARDAMRRHVQAVAAGAQLVFTPQRDR